MDNAIRNLKRACDNECYEGFYFEGTGKYEGISLQLSSETLNTTDFFANFNYPELAMNYSICESKELLGTYYNNIEDFYKLFYEKILVRRKEINDRLSKKLSALEPIFSYNECGHGRYDYGVKEYTLKFRHSMRIRYMVCVSLVKDEKIIATKNFMSNDFLYDYSISPEELVDMMLKETE